MKRWGLLVASIIYLMIFSLSALASELALGTAISFKLTQPIKVDGDLSDWPAEILKFPGKIDSQDQFVIGANDWGGPSDYSCTFYTAWDDENFYFIAQVVDDLIFCDDLLSRDYFGSDYLRVYICLEQGAGFGKGDYAFSIIPKGPGGKPAFKLVPYGVYDYEDFPFEQVKLASKVTSSGYVIEMSVPWTALEFQPKPGNVYGFQIIGGDSDKSGSRNHEALWKRTTSGNYWENKGSFGQIILQEDRFLGLELARTRVYSDDEISGIFQVGLLKAQECESMSLVIKQGEQIITEEFLQTPSLKQFNRIPFRVQPTLEPGIYDVVGRIKFADRVTESMPQQLIVAQELVWSQIEDPDLLRLAGAGNASMNPASGISDFENRVCQKGDKFIFEYDGEVYLRYELTPNTGTMSDLAIYINDSLFLTPSQRSGPLPIVDGKMVTLTSLSPQLTAAELEGDKVRLSFNFRYGDQQGKLEYEISIKEKTLIWQVNSQQNFYATFNGGFELTDSDRVVEIPYYPAPVLTFERDGIWVSAFFDWNYTNSSRLEKEGPVAVYSPKTDGQRNNLAEIFYLVVSADIREVFPNIPNPESPYRELLAQKVIFDFWGGWPFEELGRYLEILKKYGLDDLAIIQHNWQYMGYDNGFPETIPARENMGGEKGMKALTSKIHQLGYLYALHENYQDIYPNFSGYTEEAVARSSNNSLLKAWFNPSTGIQSYMCKTDWQRRYAGFYSNEIKKRYNTNMGYHDGKIIAAFPTAWDYDAKAENSAMLRGTREHGQWLADFFRETYGGPILGEGGEHSSWAGIFDGAEAQVTGGQKAPLMVDFDLLKIHPLCVNHGLGYYERWLPGDNWAVPTERQLDDYRAMEIAYGHTGFFGDRITDYLTYPIREYYIMRPLQERFALSQPKEIAYEAAGDFLNLTEALRKDVPLDRVYIEYDNGLEIYVNRREEDWQLENVVLPQAGFFAQGDGIYAITGKFDGKIADYVETPERIYADARTYVAKLTEKIWKSVMIEPQVEELRYLGGRRFQIKYIWLVDQDIYKDYNIFVHFRNQKSTHPEKVAFGNDHAPAIPTSQWRRGYLIDDGPFTLEVPAEYGIDEFEVWIGLYGHGTRLATRKVGTLVCEGSGHSISNIKFVPEPEDKIEPFVEGCNPWGTIIDFGKLATNGAIRVEREEDSLVIMPIPQGVNIQVRIGPELLGSRQVTQITALNEQKRAIGKVSFESLADGSIQFETGNSKAWYYQVSLK